MNGNIETIHRQTQTNSDSWLNWNLKCRFSWRKKHERKEGVEEKNEQQTQAAYEAELRMLAQAGGC